MNVRLSHSKHPGRPARLFRPLVCGGALLISWLPLACSSQESSRDTAAQGAVGELGLALSMASGTTFAVVQYQIAGPHGFSKSGAIDVNQSTTISTTLGGLPAGASYSITLSATSTDATTSCSGSASFKCSRRKPCR